MLGQVLFNLFINDLEAGENKEAAKLEADTQLLRT